ncbi:hypothetical protein HY68_32845 [Streptomyces sp. AcH 505]|uniref:ROK family protein n=1 Tax=Streptomyces sp. AcH 505 TaxID=352211 RepID=UPI0005923D88|nr:hypothetical protein HY68_32845 [Streptomyces sp. AcH 505]
MSDVPVLEIGGTHVTAALVDTVSWEPVASSVVRRPVPAQAAADDTLDAVAAVADGLGAGPGAHWGVAVPGPFDYAKGIGRFRGIGKFESLDGVDVGAGLLARLLPRPGAISFLNDADAFAVGEYRAGAARGHDRAVCITLGTGIGSSFLAAGRPLTEGPGVPPDGRVHRLTVDGLPLEEVVSRRAVRARHASLTGRHDPELDVRDIAALARDGEQSAVRTLQECFGALGRALAPWCTAFRPGVLVFGGSMTASWDVIGPAVRAGLGAAGAPAAVLVRTARRPAHAPLIGAAHWALRHTAGPAAVRT